MKINLGEVDSYIDELDDAARQKLATAVRRTVHHVLGIRDGSCYVYEEAISDACREVLAYHERQAKKREEDALFEQRRYEETKKRIIRGIY